MQKILKNTTPSDIFIQDTGVYIKANDSYLIDSQTYLLWVNSVDVVSYVMSGSIVVNNGTYDLTPSDGRRYLQYPDRLLVKQSGITITDVVTELNFTGSASVTDTGNGQATINVSATAVTEPCLREVTYIDVGGGVMVNVESNLLFEADPTNDVVQFYKEETL